MSLIPKKLAIYYGYPSGVNGTFGVNAAANVFKDYDLVVFGAGLEDTSHPDYENTKNIIAHVDLTNTKVFGYIDATLPLDTIQGKIDQWAATGVKGIFLDQFGYDFGVSRTKQREILWCIHEKGSGNLLAFVNAWNPDDVFGSANDATFNPSGLSPNIKPSDIYLAESFAIKNGAFDDDDLNTNGIKDWQDKANKLVAYRSTFGTKIAAIATTGSIPFDQNKADYSYFASILNKFNYWGWGEEFFSASSGSLPFVTRKPFLGTEFKGDIIVNNGKYQRRTNAGISLDTTNHTVDFIVDG